MLFINFRFFNVEKLDYKCYILNGKKVQMGRHARN